MECIFCKIVRGEVPSEKVYETEKAVAFLDLFPLNKGHLLVIPKAHREVLIDIEEETLKELILVTKKVAQSILKVFNPDGYHILMNAGKVAGQEIEHAHIHVIPRFKDDGVAFGWRHLQYGNDELREYGERLRKAIE